MTNKTVLHWVVSACLLNIGLFLIIPSAEWHIVKAGDCYDIALGWSSVGEDCLTLEGATARLERIQEDEAFNQLDWTAYEVPGDK